MNIKRATVFAAIGAAITPLALLIEGYGGNPGLTALFGAAAGATISAIADYNPAPSR